MGIFSFFARAKAKSLGDDAIRALAAIDPETMSEAGLAQQEAELDKLLKEVAGARADHAREKSEAVAARDNLNRQIAAAEVLAGKLEQQTPGSSEYVALEATLTKQLDNIDRLTSETEREEAEEKDAAETLSIMESAAKEAADQLKQLRADLKEAANAQRKAETQAQRAQRDAERAATVAGIRKSGSAVNSALDAMRKNAAEAQQRADAARSKADLLNPSTPADPLLAQALAEAEGKAAPAVNPMDRLAALRNKK